MSAKINEIENGPGTFDIMKSILASSDTSSTERNCTFKIRMGTILVPVKLLVLSMEREDGSGKSFIVRLYKSGGPSRGYKGYYNIKTRTGFIEDYVL